MIRLALPGVSGYGNVMVDLKLEVDAETLAAIQRGAQDADEGRTVSLERARQLIPQWISKFESSPRR